MTMVPAQSLAGTHSVPGKSRSPRPQVAWLLPSKNSQVSGHSCWRVPLHHPSRPLAGVSTRLVFCLHTRAVREAKVSICFSFYLRPQSRLRSGSVYSQLVGQIRLGTWIALNFDSLLFALLLLFLARCHV